MHGTYSYWKSLWFISNPNESRRLYLEALFPLPPHGAWVLVERRGGDGEQVNKQPSTFKEWLNNDTARCDSTPGQVGGVFGWGSDCRLSPAGDTFNSSEVLLRKSPLKGTRETPRRAEGAGRGEGLLNLT